VHYAFSIQSRHIFASIPPLILEAIAMGSYSSDLLLKLAVTILTFGGVCWGIVSVQGELSVEKNATKIQATL